MDPNRFLAVLNKEINGMYDDVKLQTQAQSKNVVHLNTIIFIHEYKSLGL